MSKSIADFIIRIATQGQEKLAQVKKGMDDITASAGKAQQSTDTFASKLGSSLDGLSKNIGLTSLSMAGLAGAIGFMGMKAINLADEIGDISDATGISAGRLLNFKQSLIEAGGKAEDMSKFATKLSQSLGDAANGNEKTRKTFRDLGVDLGDANGKLRDTDDLLPEVIDALANIENPAERAATAVEILGKSAKSIDWTKVTAGRDAIKDEQIKQLADYRNELDKLANTLETKLLTAFGKIALATNKGTWADGIAVGIEQIGYALGKVIPGVTAIAKLAEQSRTGVTVNGDNQEELMAGYKSRAGIGRDSVAKAKTGQLADTKETVAANAAARAQTEALAKVNAEALKYQQILNTTIGLNQTEAEVIKTTAQIEQQRATKVAELQKAIAEAGKEQIESRRNTQIAEIQKQIDLTNKQAVAMTAAREQGIRLTQQQADAQANLNQQIQFEAQDLAVKQAARQAELIGLYGQELQLKSGLIDIENERARTALAARAKIEALGEKATAEDINRAANEIIQAQAVADAKVKILQDRLAKEDALKNDAAAGEKKALYDIAESFKPYNLAQQKTQMLWGTVSNALDTFVETGKISFGGLAKSIIQDLIKIELKTQANGLFSAMGGFSGIFGGVKSLLGFANGGEPPVGVPSIVGENGPELFVPKTAGTVLPNGVGMGGQTVNNTYVTNNISAVDSQSVAQLFANNRRTLLGVVETARKELPLRQR